jgi:hypothetical protein
MLQNAEIGILQHCGLYPGFHWAAVFGRLDKRRQ